MRLDTFGELCANPADYLSIDIGSTWIDFVLDTYRNRNSAKNSERSRHSQSRAIEISYLARATPVDMGSVWSSRNNKTTLPQLLREQLVDLPSRRCSAELVVIGIGGESAQHCKCVHNASHASVGSGYRH